MGLEEAGLEKLIRASYHLLGLISFLTTGPDETRAWTITRGKAGNSSELQQLRKNVFDRKKIVANPQLRLDAIRLVVCR